MAEQPPRERTDLVARHLGLAWQALTPEPSLQDRVRARLTSSAAATMGAIGAGAALKVRPEGSWASLQATGKLGTTLAGAGLLGLGLLSGYLLRDAQQEAPPAAPVARSSAAMPALHPELSTAPAVTAPAREVPAAAEPSAVRRGQRRPNAPPVQSAAASPLASAEPATAPINEELALLRRAEHAVRGGNSALALALIAELEARYPRSSLLEERRAVELLAYCGAGATDAQARAERFLREHPRSVHAGRVAAQCAGAGELSRSGR